MGLLNSVIGALAESNLRSNGRHHSQAHHPAFNAVVGMLANNSQVGGLYGLLGRMQQGGLGDVASSWISNGQNLPVSADDLRRVLGDDLLTSLADQFNLGAGDLAGQLSQLLPQLVDRLTPDGEAPHEGLGDITSIVGRLTRH